MQKSEKENVLLKRKDFPGGTRQTKNPDFISSKYQVDIYDQ